MPATSSPRLYLTLALAALVVIAPHDALAGKKKRAHRAALPPIAFFQSAYGNLRAKTAKDAIARCHAQQKKDLARNADKRLHTNPRICESMLVTVRGPYKRTKGRGGDDDIEVFNYRGSDGVWYDKNGDTPCFAVGTPIATPEGDRPIELVEPGTVVYAYDVATKRVVQASVLRTKRRSGKPVATLTFSDGARVAVTANHPFFSVTAGAWVEAGRLSTGDKILELHDGRVEEAVLVERTRFEGAAEVVNLTVAGQHDYFAGGVLVHNY